MIVTWLIPALAGWTPIPGPQAALELTAKPAHEAPQSLEQGFELRTGELTVVLQQLPQDVDLWAAGLTGAARGAQVLRSNHLGIVDLALPVGADLAAVEQALQARSEVRFTERVYTGRYSQLPDDPEFGNQDHLRNLGQTGGAVDADTDAEHVWDLTTGDPSIVIAVVDSGTDINHPDLAPNVWSNLGEIPGNGLDDDNNGFVDDLNGWDFQSGTPSPITSGEHGTWVAGCIGARNNNGFTGGSLAGGWGNEPGCSLMCISVGAASPDAAVMDDAIIYAADNGARIITMSLSVPQSGAIDMALDYARNTQGVFIDCASGNGFFGSGPVSYPATNPNVVAVGGTTNTDSHWPSGNSGPQVLVAAKAQDVRTTAFGNTTEAVSGTSFAAPQVAAVAGLMLSVNPNLTAQEITFILGGTADDAHVPGPDPQTGRGRVNAWKAVLAAIDPDCDGNGTVDVFEIATGAAVDADGNLQLDSCQSLFQSAASLSLAAGANLTLDIDAGPGHAGELYVLAGSGTGSFPGLDVGGFSLPLNFSDYLLLTLQDPNAAPFANFQGTLDGAGQAQAQLNVAPGTAPGLAGRVLYHAFLTFDLANLGVTSASNAVSLELLP
jgi:subtilisin family serine protease